MANILIADDEQSIRAFMCRLLWQDGHTVETAADGVAALRACRAQPFDLLFCDAFMPGMEWLETIRTLRNEFPRLKIVAMSGGAHNYGGDQLQAARGMGAAATLEKPFKWDEVKQALQKAIQPAASDTLDLYPSHAPQPALSQPTHAFVLVNVTEAAERLTYVWVD